MSLIHSYLENLDMNHEVEIVPLHVLLPDRLFLHEFEIQQYLVYAVFVVILGNNHSRLAAFHEALTDLESPEDFMELAHSMIMAEKIRTVVDLIDKS
jgi:hypothetical protein